jgi:hypothetical protein
VPSVTPDGIDGGTRRKKEKKPKQKKRNKIFKESEV